MPEIIERPSPNFDVRDCAIDMLVLHYTAMETATAALDWLCNPESKVSTHYLIDEAGKVFRLVTEDQRAWHAGVANWFEETNINARSIGIELHNPGPELGDPPFEEAQMVALIDLVREIIARHDIAATRVLGHSDVAPIRKRDPGEKFDWARLADAGIGFWPDHTGAADQKVDPRSNGDEVSALQSMLGAYGYGVTRSGKYDDETKAVVTAFQRHFRPANVDGIADGETLGILEALLIRLGDT
jgi:N-acetylmuramoyl-L-alanine amidase